MLAIRRNHLEFGSGFVTWQADVPWSRALQRAGRERADRPRRTRHDVFLRCRWGRATRSMKVHDQTRITARTDQERAFIPGSGTLDLPNEQRLRKRRVSGQDATLHAGDCCARNALP